MLSDILSEFATELATKKEKELSIINKQEALKNSQQKINAYLVEKYEKTPDISTDMFRNQKAGKREEQNKKDFAWLMQAEGKLQKLKDAEKQKKETNQWHLMTTGSKAYEESLNALRKDIIKEIWMTKNLLNYHDIEHFPNYDISSDEMKMILKSLKNSLKTELQIKENEKTQAELEVSALIVDYQLKIDKQESMRAEENEANAASDKAKLEKELAAAKAALDKAEREANEAKENLSLTEKEEKISEYPKISNKGPVFIS